MLCRLSGSAVPLRWRLFYLGLLAVDLARLAAHLFITYSIFPTGVMQILVLVYSIEAIPATLLVPLLWFELQDASRRPWTHWAGILAMVWSAGLQVFMLGKFLIEFYITGRV